MLGGQVTRIREGAAERECLLAHRVADLGERSLTIGELRARSMARESRCFAHGRRPRSRQIITLAARSIGPPPQHHRDARLAALAVPDQPPDRHPTVLLGVVWTRASRQEYLSESIQVIEKLDRNQIEKMATLLADARERGGRLFVLGVGGSAANASLP